MSRASAKGLQREGFRTYVLKGPRRTYAIDRDGPRKFIVRPYSHPRCPGGFFAQSFTRLGDARRYAEICAGIDPAQPNFLRRWQKASSDNRQTVA